MTYDKNLKVRDANKDPITGEPGAHPVGAGVGAAAGGAAGVAGAAVAGAAMGTALGPIGIVAGAAVGGIVGGLVGKDIAEDINPTIEDAYWRENYNSRPYASKDSNYETYQPAYRHGVDSYSKYEGRKFADVEAQVRQDWENNRNDSNLDWDSALPATRDSYEKLSNRK